MDTLFDDSLVQEFITESREHLDSIEPDLLLVEEQGKAAAGEVVHRIFRAIHSVKGGASFLAYDALKGLSHKMESVLMLIRDGELEISAPITDVLLRSVDKLRLMLDDVTASDSVECGEESALLEQYMNGGAAPAAEAQPEAAPAGTDDRLSAFDWQSEAMRSLLAKASPVYLVEVIPAEDISAEERTAEAFIQNTLSLGTPFLAGGEELAAALAAGKPFTFVFGTVLEDDLAAAALELPEERVCALSAETLDNLSKSSVAAPVAPQAQVPQPVAPKAETAVEVQEIAPEKNVAAPAARAARVENAETLRVRLDLLTRLMNSAGELVLARNQLFKAMEGMNDQPQLAALLQNMDRVTAEIQGSVMQTRLQPVGGVFGKFPRVVRDIARKLGKEIEVNLSGTEVEVDRSVIELISDPLTHIIRNCADHAIETPDERAANGKPRSGTIEIAAYHEGGQVIVAVIDDGRGIDPEKIRKSAEKKGVITPEQGQRMSDSDLVNLIFAPGFSTAEQITDVSGRGVGMDVVRTNIEKLGGSVEVDSRIGAGTTVFLRIPLTLAIVPALLAGVQDDQFAVPQTSVEEIVWVRAKDVKSQIGRVHDKDVLRLRNTLLPLVRLADILGIERTFEHPETHEPLPDRRARLSDRRGGTESVDFERRDGDRRTNWRGDYRIIVVRSGRTRYGLVVDRLFDSEDIVMKPLSGHLKNVRCFSGATITGDGRVITVLDIEGVAAMAELSQNADLQRASEDYASKQEQTTRQAVVLFRNAARETFAVPQSALLRLERLELDTVQTLGSEEFVNYRGRSLPVVRLEQRLPVGAFPAHLQHGYLLVPKPAAGAAPEGGVLVSEIVDAIEMKGECEPSRIAGPGVLGSTVYEGEMVTLLDPAALVSNAVLN
ncbi:MAG: hypothetical protein GC168_00995 [Candidatus Hydrogenedens sp.]|nr:hypothetical protein [Candidatus Hydrogenedens sp.]